MRIGPFIFGRKATADVCCFTLAGFQAECQRNPDLPLEIEEALQDVGVVELGVWSPDELWCVEDPTGPERAKRVFEKFGFSPVVTDPERGKRFHRFTIGYSPRGKGG